MSPGVMGVDLQHLSSALITDRVCGEDRRSAFETWTWLRRSPLVWKFLGTFPPSRITGSSSVLSCLPRFGSLVLARAIRRVRISGRFVSRASSSSFILRPHRAVISVRLRRRPQDRGFPRTEVNGPSLDDDNMSEYCATSQGTAPAFDARC